MSQTHSRESRRLCFAARNIAVGRIGRSRARVGAANASEPVWTGVAVVSDCQSRSVACGRRCGWQQRQSAVQLPQETHGERSDAGTGQQSPVFSPSPQHATPFAQQHGVANATDGMQIKTANSRWKILRNSDLVPMMSLFGGATRESTAEMMSEAFRQRAKNTGGLGLGLPTFSRTVGVIVLHYETNPGGLPGLPPPMNRQSGLQRKDTVPSTQRAFWGASLAWSKTRKTGDLGTRRCRAFVARSATLPPGGSDAVAAGEGKGDDR